VLILLAPVNSVSRFSQSKASWRTSLGAAAGVSSLLFQNWSHDEIVYSFSSIIELIT
jgi:hypothetical protein